MADFPEGSDRIQIAIGLKNWREGETSLSVDRQGKAAVSNLRADKVIQFDGVLPTQQLEELAAAVNAVAQISPQKQPRKPGDVPIKLAWYAGNTVQGHNDDFWYGDRYTMTDVNQLIRLFNQIVKQISNGRISA